MKLFDVQPYAGKRVCVALSGGRDSVALLHFFFENAVRYNIVLSALTCEHGLRGKASRADLAFFVPTLRGLPQSKAWAWRKRAGTGGTPVFAECWKRTART